MANRLRESRNELLAQADKFAAEFVSDPETRAAAIEAYRNQGSDAIADALEEAVVISRAYLSLRSETAFSRDAVIEEVAKRVETATLTYMGPDPGGIKDLKFLIVETIRDMKGA